MKFKDQNIVLTQVFTCIIGLFLVLYACSFLPTSSTSLYLIDSSFSHSNDSATNLNKNSESISNIDEQSQAPKTAQRAQIKLSTAMTKDQIYVSSLSLAFFIATASFWLFSQRKRLEYLYFGLYITSACLYLLACQSNNPFIYSTLSEFPTSELFLSNLTLVFLLLFTQSFLTINKQQTTIHTIWFYLISTSIIGCLTSFINTINIDAIGNFNITIILIVHVFIVAVCMVRFAQGNRYVTGIILSKLAVCLIFILYLLHHNFHITIIDGDLSNAVYCFFIGDIIVTLMCLSHKDSNIDSQIKFNLMRLNTILAQQVLSTNKQSMSVINFYKQKDYDFRNNPSIRYLIHDVSQNFFTAKLLIDDLKNTSIIHKSVQNLEENLSEMENVFENALTVILDNQEPEKPIILNDIFNSANQACLPSAQTKKVGLRQRATNQKIMFNAVILEKVIEYLLSFSITASTKGEILLASRVKSDRSTITIYTTNVNPLSIFELPQPIQNTFKKIFIPNTVSSDIMLAAELCKHAGYSLTIKHISSSSMIISVDNIDTTQ